MSACVSAGTAESATWEQLVTGSVLACGADDVAGKCVVLAMRDEMTAAAALVELDGAARRIVLCPPDLPREQLAGVAQIAGADLVLADEAIELPAEMRVLHTTALHPRMSEEDCSAECATEWILLTSGTTGSPKLVEHTLASLTGAIEASQQPGVVWGTYYDIRRYGGLQIFLRAVLTGTALVLKGAKEGMSDFLVRSGKLGVTHLLGTPSHWRSALMSGMAAAIAPRYVRLSGEVADQAILDQLRQQYPQAVLVHAFASTEAGVAFAVEDGRMGVQHDVLTGTPGVEMKVEEGTLRIRSNRTARRYLNPGLQSLRDADGFVNTGDVLADVPDDREGRLHFAGRHDGVINVGGLKVHPEEVEAVLNRHPQVSMSLVKSKKNSIIGAVVVADVILRDGFNGTAEAKRGILEFCRAELAHHKRPAAINIVSSIEVGASGKLVRHA